MYPKFDAGASLRIWAVETTLAGQLLRIPALPACDWLPALMTGNVFQLRGLLEGFDLATAVLEEEITLKDLEEALVFLVESAAGRSIKTTVLTASSASERWDVIGSDLIRAGVRFDQISLGAALDAMYGSLMRHMDEKGQREFNRLLMDVVEAPRRRRLPQRDEPLPANVLQSLSKRPKTVLRKPPSPPDDPSGQPTPQPAPPDGNDLVATSARRRTGVGGGRPQRL